MGYALRTHEYRFIQWVKWNGTSQEPIWSNVYASELYNHSEDNGHWTDPDRFENKNLFESADPNLVDSLTKLLREKFRN